MIINLFEKTAAEDTIGRIQGLKPASTPHWGKMDAAQMLAHLNVAYALTYTPERFKKPGALKKLLLKTFVKKMVTGEKPYPKNSRTSPEFMITGQRDFDKEKEAFINHIRKTQELGAGHFEGKDNFSFGKMTAQEWNNLFAKHISHHLAQFGV